MIPKPLGGWLLVFVIGHLVGISRILLDIKDILPLLSTPAALVGTVMLFHGVLSILGFSYIAFLAAIKRKRSTIITIQLCLWGFGPVLNGIFLCAEYFLLSSHYQIGIEVANDFRDEIIRDLVRSLISATVWSLYFKRSKRVKETFVLD